jgi:hypothetical protein
VSLSIRWPNPPALPHRSGRKTDVQQQTRCIAFRRQRGELVRDDPYGPAGLVGSATIPLREDLGRSGIFLAGTERAGWIVIRLCRSSGVTAKIMRSLHPFSSDDHPLFGGWILSQFGRPVYPLFVSIRHVWPSELARCVNRPAPGPSHAAPTTISANIQPQSGNLLGRRGASGPLSW